MTELDDNQTAVESASEPVVPPAPEPEQEPAPEPAPEPVVTPEPAPEPEADPVPQAPDAALVEAVRGGLTWVPFALYLLAWVALAGLSAYFFRDASPEQPARWMPEYEPLLWSAVGLTALGPVLSLAVWLVARARRPKAERRGLFSSAMTRGALVTFFGVLLWTGTLFVLELMASGWTL